MSVAAPANRRVLVVDRDAAMRERASAILRNAGYPTFEAAGPEEARAALETRPYDLIVAELDLTLEGRLTRLVPSEVPPPPTLVLADGGRMSDALRALRLGACDYAQRPPDPLELKVRVGRILELGELDSRVALLQNEVARNVGFKALVARSPAMRVVVDRLARVAPMRATVLIHGESGVGKELVARAIHLNSPRKEFPFIAINCAAIPGNLIESELFGHEKGSFTGAHARARGKFEIAHRGTLFLDEIGEMDPASQAKLLRVLDEKEFMRVGGDQSVRVDVRVIAATNADLEKEVEKRTFRRDLYYRLKVVTISVPRLRDRPEDIPVLVEGFLDELARTNAVRPKSITHAALEAITTYQWPGNVRELKNVIESLLVSSPGDVIDVRDLPPALVREARPAPAQGVKPGISLAEMEAALIRKTLEHTGGNRTHSAEILGIGVRTLQRKIRELGLEIPSTSRRPRRRLTSV